MTTRIRRLAWATDVHLNFLDQGGVEAFSESLRRQDADAVLITGDIAEAPSLERLLGEAATQVGVPIYFVLGNHDYYRSSIAEVRALVERMTARDPRLRWLPALGALELTPEVGLVGVDGWSDGRLGDFHGSPVVLNDYVYIKELSGISPAARLERLHRLGDEEAARLRGPLRAALERHAKVMVATHVPPFREACWHDGKVSNDDWLPHFTCHAVGQVLRELAREFPARKIRVFCGHTHGAGSAEILPNLSVITGAAEYGEPRVQGILELG